PPPGAASSREPNTPSPSLGRAHGGERRRDHAPTADLDVTLTGGTMVEVNDRNDGWAPLLAAIAQNLDLACSDRYAALASLVPDGDSLFIAEGRMAP
ncbi:hypothetical protein, partial [Jiangella rhizosphaerae]|uniref:hypothetical protein n=1 Tax=Jiangella rhizosphaerae TaxID=2293569 RepID=UPI001F3EE7F5